MENRSFKRRNIVWDSVYFLYPFVLGGARFLWPEGGYQTWMSSANRIGKHLGMLKSPHVAFPANES